MTGDQYVETILAKYAVPRGSTSPAERLVTAVAGPIRAWAGAQLNELEYSGSYAKETGVHGVSDVDLFISLKSDTKQTLKELFDGVMQLAKDNRWSPRAQNVSVGITVNDTKADLVPGKVQAGFRNYHSLYLRKRDSWTQTNVAMHIDTVRDSGRVREIRAVKTWKALHGVEWPSLYLELFTINALSGRSRNALADNVLHVLREAGATMTSRRIVDPGNSSNVISDDLTQAEKQRLAAVAAESARKGTWAEIIW